MSRYQARHRSPTPPIWRNARVAIPVVAAAGLTLAAAGIEQTATSGTAAADVPLTAPKVNAATIIDRSHVTAVARSQARTDARAAQVAAQQKAAADQAAADKAAADKAAADKAAADKAAAERKKALAALTGTPAKDLPAKTSRSLTSARPTTASATG